MSGQARRVSSNDSYFETVSFGHITGGMIQITLAGADAYGPHGEYVATFPTLSAARKALFQLHQCSEQGLHG